MRYQNILYILFALLAFTACKKERSPRLVVSVQQEDGSVAPSATVRAHPGSANEGTLNEEFDQTLVADGQGKAFFDFPYSAVLNVDATFVSPVTGDTLIGSTVVKIESVRQRDEVNDFEGTVIVK